MTAQRAGRMVAFAFAFAGLGGTAAVVPAVIPSMASELGAEASVLLPAVAILFLGLLVGVLGASFIATRRSLSTLLRAGASAQAAGLVLAACVPEPIWFIVGAGVTGVGFGFVEAGGTAAVRVLGSEGAPRLLTRLTLIVAVVATITPLAVLGVASLGWVRLLPVAIATIHVISIIALRGVQLAPPPTKTLSSASTVLQPSLTRFYFLAAALFCYVGAETVISGWSAATVEHELGTTAAVAALGTSAFWLLMSLGRLVGAAATGTWRAGHIALLYSAAVACFLGLAAASNEANATASLIFLGVAVFASGPCYALLLGIAVGQFSEHRAIQKSSSLVALGAAGGAIIPLIAASTTIAFGPKASTVTAAVAAGCMFIFFLASRAWRGPEAVSVTPPKAASGTATRIVS